MLTTPLRPLSPITHVRYHAALEPGDRDPLPAASSASGGRSSMRGPCVELLDLSTPLRRCGRPGVGVSLPCPSGRPNAVGGPYCEEHGGLARAQHEAETEWDYVAPASVGDSEAVLSAGCASLDSSNVYVVLRHEGSRWLAWLGVGGHMVGVHAPGTRPHRKHHESKAAYEERCRAGGYAFASREAAEAEGVRVWRETVDRDVADITRQRGGTLSWGMPIAPLADPVVIDATGRNAWDCVGTGPGV